MNTLNPPGPDEVAPCSAMFSPGLSPCFFQLFIAVKAIIFSVTGVQAQGLDCCSLGFLLTIQVPERVESSVPGQGKALRPQLCTHMGNQAGAFSWSFSLPLCKQTL